MFSPEPVKLRLMNSKGDQTGLYSFTPDYLITERIFHHETSSLVISIVQFS